MTKTVRAVIFDPFHPGENFLREEQIGTDLASLQAVVKGRIEGIYPAYQDRALEGLHGYVNEEFLYTNPEWRTRPWSFTGYPNLCGPAIFLGSTPDGDEADCPFSLKEIGSHIRMPVTTAALITEQVWLAREGG